MKLVILVLAVLSFNAQATWLERFGGTSEDIAKISADSSVGQKLLSLNSWDFSVANVRGINFERGEVTNTPVTMLYSVTFNAIVGGKDEMQICKLPVRLGGHRIVGFLEVTCTPIVRSGKAAL